MSSPIALSEVVAGVDEAGRGPLAGPVVAAAVILDPRHPIKGLADSKKLSAKRRESLAAQIRDSAIAWCVISIDAEQIDRINILEATRLAMAAAARTLIVPRSVVITDHVHPGDLGCRILSPKKADRDYFSVAAASIVAKVHRDRIMVDLGRQDPRWKWEWNKGYGTVDHRRALQNAGPGTLHRRSFGWSPVLP